MFRSFLVSSFFVALIVSQTQGHRGEKMATDLPLYWGWFLGRADTTEFLQISRDQLSDALTDIDKFREDVQIFTGQTSTEEILAHYTREDPDDVLHCTAMYNGLYPDYTPGAEEYADKAVVKENIEEPFIIQAVGWILTPRTFGARLKLNEDQLRLWNQSDTEGNPPKNFIQRYSSSLKPRRSSLTLKSTPKSGRVLVIPQDPDLDQFRPTSGFGSRAHLTLGCSPNVSAVTTGYDLVDVIRLEQANATYSEYELKNGALRDYGLGQWVFYPKNRCLLAGVFRGSDSGQVSSAPARGKDSRFFISFAALCWILRWFGWSWDKTVQ